jgi:DNA repair exonuclease SbcCD nuclease subunit
MRILHFADVHLHRPFVGFRPGEAAVRRRELFDAFRRCLAQARERDADVVTIAGDLWEEEHVTADTANSVAHELEQLGLPVIIACGNHDRRGPGGTYMRTRWPSNVHIAPLRNAQEFRFGELSLWAISWGDDDFPVNFLNRTEVPRDGRSHILVVHGSSKPVSVGDFARYFPFEPADVREAGFDRCLAGHIHMASDFEGVVYPGSPEPLGWAEAGRHRVALVEIGAAGIDVQLIDVNERRYETRAIDCNGSASSAEIETRVADALSDNDADRIFLRARLVGEIGPDCVVETEPLRARHASRYAALVLEDRTEPLLDIEARAARKGLDGLFVSKLRDRIEHAESERERQIAELALQAGLRALEGREVILRVD